MKSTLSRSPKQSRGMLRSSLVVASMTMVSRVLGLVRDIVFARFIGAGGDADAFFLAFKIPNFLRRLFAEGAFSQAFVPVLAEYRERGSVEAVRHLVDRVAGALGLSVFLLTVVVIFAAPAVTAVIGFGYLFKGGGQFALTSELLRITFPYLFLISLTGLTGAILNSYGRFAVPAFTPVILNVCLITSAAFVAPSMERPVFALAWGVVAAGSLQFLFQLPFVHHLGLLPHPKLDWQDESVKKVLKLMGPAIFGASVGQINLMFDQIIATLLPLGSISWLYFSDRLMELPLGVFGVGIATVVLPALSRQFSSGSEHFSKTLDWALRMMILAGLPAAIALMVVAKPLLLTLFQYGKTDLFAIEMASWSLRAYSIGLLAFMLIKVLASAYFSRQDTRTPVRIGVISMLSNMVMNVAFVVPLAYYWDIGHAGLALATSFSALINALLLYRGLRRSNIYQLQPGWRLFIGRIMLANLAMVGVLAYLMSVQADLSLLAWKARATSLFVLCVAGVGTYVITMMIFGFRMRDIRVAGERSSGT